MRAFPSAMVPLFEFTGEATPALRELLGIVPRGPLVDFEGRATPLFRHFLTDKVGTPLPNPSEPLADKLRRPTRAMTLMLMGLR